MKGTFSTRTCPTPGCGRPLRRNQFARLGVSSHCERCRQRIRRHGDVQQEPVRRSEVRKIATRLKRLVKRGGKQERVEMALRQLASNLADVTVDDLLHPAPNGKSKPWVNIWHHKTVEVLQQVVGDTDAVKSGYLVAACFVLREEDRRRFVSDHAFNVQLVRMWRAQTTLSCGTTYNAEKDQVTGWWKDLAPRVVLLLADVLTTAYAPVVGLAVAALRKERERQAALRTNLSEGFAPLLADWSHRVSTP